jgi:hypothetical protein
MTTVVHDSSPTILKHSSFRIDDETGERQHSTVQEVDASALGWQPDEICDEFEYGGCRWNMEREVWLHDESGPFDRLFSVCRSQAGKVLIVHNK